MYQKIIILHGSQQKKYPEPIPAGTKITVSWKDYTPGGENNPAVDFRDAENKVVKSFEFPNGQNTYTFTSDKEIATTNVYANGYSHAGSIGITTIINNLMVNIGEAKPYEEYGAMPGNKFPSRIRGCGDNVNLYDFENATITKIGGTEVVTKKENGVKIECTGNNTYGAILGTFVADKIEDYTISLKSEGMDTSTSQWGVRVEYADGTYSNTANANTFTFTPKQKNEIITISYYVRLGQSFTGTVILSDIKIEKGSVATPYSRFKEGNVNFTICNKNMLKYDVKTQTINGITFTVNKDKSITANGTATANVILDMVGNSRDFALSLKAGDYVLSGCTNGSKDTYMIEVYDKTYYRHVTDGRILINFTEDVSIRAYIAIKSGVTMSNVTFYPMLEENNKVTNYVEHKEQNITFPLKQKLYKTDFLAEDGIHHARKEIELVGVTNGLKINNVVKHTNDIYYCTVSLPKTAVNGSIVYCSHFKSQNKGVVEGHCYITGGGNILVLVLEDQTITTAEQANIWLAEQKEAGTAVTVNYLLATEELEEYSAEQQKVYNEIMQAKSYREKTHIFSQDEISPKFDVEWIKDTSIILNNLSKSIVGGN